MEGGLCRLRTVSMAEPSTLDDELVAWPADRARLDVQFAPVSLEALRAELLDDEFFNDRSEGDSAWFDPTPQGDDGIARRDEALRTFVELTQPLRFLRFLDESRTGALVPFTILLLSSPVEAGVLFVAPVWRAVHRWRTSSQDHPNWRSSGHARRRDVAAWRQRPTA